MKQGSPFPTAETTPSNALSAEEVDTLIAIKGKLSGSDEVAGHARSLDDTGYVVW